MADETHFEYALLALRAWRFDRVTHPDGTVEDVAQGKGADAAERWLRAKYDDQMSPAGFKKIHDAWRNGYEPWRRSLRVTEDVTLLGTGRRERKLPVIRIAGESFSWDLAPTASVRGYTVTPRPRGSYVVWDPLAREGKQIIRASFDEAKRLLADAAERVMRDDLYPQLNPEPRQHYVFHTWKAELHRQPQVETGQQRWIATISTSTGAEKLAINEHGQTYGWPIAQVTGTLNRLGADRWQVISVTEDKGLYSGVGTDSESGPVAVRYLLMRSMP